MRLLLVLTLAAEGALCHQDPLYSPLNQLMQAEDRRGSIEADIVTLRDAARAEESSLRRAAARSLGRLERADLLPDILPLLEDRRRLGARCRGYRRGPGIEPWPGRRRV